MNIFDKFFKKFSYKFDKGYPNMDNPKDVLLLESIISELLGEEYILEAPSPDIKDGIEVLKQKYKFNDDDFKEVTGKTYKILVPKDKREDYFKEISDLEGFKAKEQNKVTYNDKATFLIKPKDSSESYNIKPQNVGVKGDYEYTIDELLSDVKKGLNSVPTISPLQKEYLIQYLDNDIKLTPEQVEEITSDKNFLNQVQKNFSEISGVIHYIEEILKEPNSKIEFPLKGNEKLVDSYVIKPDGTRVRISSKAKSGGNIVKPEGLLDSAKETNYKFKDEDKEEILNTINDFSVVPVNLKLAKYGDEKVDAMKKQLESALKNDPKLKDPNNRQLQYNLERELIRQINSQFDFSDIFNDLLDVVYVKTNTNAKTGVPKYSVVDPGNYRVVLQSKNTANPTRSLERIGFQMRG